MTFVNLHKIQNQIVILKLFNSTTYPGYKLTSEDKTKLADAIRVLDELTQSSNFFGPIKDEYAFFVKHSNEAEKTAEAVGPIIDSYIQRHPGCKLLDFGCGNGDFLRNLLGSSHCKDVDIQLIEVDPIYLAEAQSKLQELSRHPIRASKTKITAFDIGIANHVLYYVDSLEDTLTELYSNMGSQFLITLANRKNDLVRLNEEFCELHDIDYPKWVAEDLDLALNSLGIEYEKRELSSALMFSDSRENRETVIRFINNMQIKEFNKMDEMLSSFDTYQMGSKILLSLSDTLFILKK